MNYDQSMFNASKFYPPNEWNENVFTYKVKFLTYDTVTAGEGLHKKALKYTV